MKLQGVWRGVREKGISKMKKVVKFITCGSVDDGKSTLIGHMLYDAKLIFADQKRALELDSKVGSNDGDIDYSLLLDGLMAEREQGITIDVAYRYFTTEKRSFIVADCPGHEQYTRNMAVGASFADVAVILVDASKGVQVQTRRHARICALMGIKHLVLAVNKIDLVEYREEVYKDISLEFYALCDQLKVEHVDIIPVSALVGDNITTPSYKTPWYVGKPLLETLEEIEIDDLSDVKGFALPVQRVCRPNHTFRGFQGEIACGSVLVGDEVEALPSSVKAVVTEIYKKDGKVESAREGDPVTLCLDTEIDVSRGSVLTKDTSLKKNKLFSANILWMDDRDLFPGRTYLLKCGTKSVTASIIKVKYKIDIDSGKHFEIKDIGKNDIVEVDISTSEPIIFDKFESTQYFGRFVLIDIVFNMTSACGIILHDKRRGTNITWYETSITTDSRALQKSQKPLTLWFTGLSGSGKSTLANALEVELVKMGKHTMLLDGDNVRHGLNNDLGFTEEDRIENIRRVAEVSKLMNDAGLIVLTAFISPYKEDREQAKKIIGEDNFIEIHVATPIEECERRDVKGLYNKARNNEIPNFTGVTSVYEKPDSADITIDTTDLSLEECVRDILSFKHIS